LAGPEGLRLIQIRLATSSFEKISLGCQANSPQTQIAACNSRNAVAFRPLAQRNAFRCHDARQRRRSFALLRYGDPDAVEYASSIAAHMTMKPPNNSQKTGQAALMEAINDTAVHFSSGRSKSCSTHGDEQFPRVHNKPAESPRCSGLELFLELNRGINLCAFRWGAHADVVGRIAECAS
jgi:hypothetical protein